MNRLVMVVEDNPITRKMMRLALESDGYEVSEASDGRSALQMASARPPELVVQDYVLPDMDGLRLLEALRSRPGCGEIPVLMITGMVSQIDELRGRAGGPTSVLPKPIEPSRLLEIVRSYLSGETAKAGRGRRVLVVDDELLGRRLAAIRLRDAGFEVETAANGEEALRTARAAPPDAILSDVLMPGMDGFELCRAVRQDPRLAHLPVVLLSSAFLEEDDRRLAREMGANTLLPRSSHMREAIDALLRAIAVGGGPSVRQNAEVTALHAERVQIQLGKQLARNESLLRQGAIQAAALSVVRGLTMALASPGDVASVLGDVLVHCLDAAGLSTGVLYLVGRDGELRLQAQAGLPSVGRELAARSFGHPEILRAALESGAPAAYVFAEAADPRLRELGAGLGRGSGLVVPFRAEDEPMGVLLLGADSQDLADPVWVNFGRALAEQFGQTIALGRFLARGAALEARYRSLMEQAHDAILLLDENGIIEANRQAETILGVPRDEIVGHRYEDFVVPEEREEVTRSLAALIETGHGRVGRRNLLRPDGTRIGMDASVSVVQVGNERFALLILRDVTERERMEQQLRQREEQYRLLFESNPHPMWVQGPDHLSFLAVNDAAVRLYGYSRDEFLRMQVTDLEQAEPTPAAHEPGLPRAGGVSRHRRKDGTTLEVQLDASEIGLAGTAAHIVLAMDVSEKRLLEAQLLQAQKMEAVGRLAGGVAHDFNNLLGVITGYSDLLHKDLESSHKGHRRIEQIERAAQRAAGLTRQLLAFSRKGVIEPRVIDLNRVVSEIEPMLRRLIGEDVDLRLLRSEGAGRVRADRGQIDQVIMNLVVNARDAMPQGGRLTIETTRVILDDREAGLIQAPPGEYVALAVADTGHGMDAETRSHIFEPFFTTKEEGKGTGLGLATVFGIVNQSGGRIVVESDPGAGTVFRVYLPSVTEAEARAPRVVEKTPPGGSETILLVEDAEALRVMVQELLEGAGYRVLEAADPDAALLAVATHAAPIDLLLIDVIMPRMSGPELAARLRAAKPRARVLFMSGYTAEAIGSKGVLKPGTRLLRKPFSAGDLLRKVREAIDAPPEDL
jgi:two-component system, cell cycle sensor histidine kinase and response regulator CckA